MKRYDWNKEKLEEAIAKKYNISETCVRKRLKRIINKQNILIK